MTDAERLDYLEAIMRPRMGFVDVHLSGVRLPAGEALSFAVELIGKLTSESETLREAIDKAAKVYPPVRM